MNHQEAQEAFRKIWDEYDRLEYPKYRQINLESALKKLGALTDLKEYLGDDPLLSPGMQ